MKLWIITSWTDTLTLFTFLSKYPHEYIVYYDDYHRPYGDKSFDHALSCIEQGVDYLVKQKVDAIIVPPVYELALSKKKTKAKILPLFSTYVMEQCFSHSLVGKIGLLWDFADLEKAQYLLQWLEKSYTLTSHQKSIKKFHSPFHYRAKEVPLRKYYLTWLSYSNVLVNKIIKFDLRYFKDAMTDTLIPFNYWYFHYQTTITKFLNFKKIKFHKMEKLETIFQERVMKDKEQTKDTYSITIAYTGHPELLKREKRIIRLLQRGNAIDIQWEKI